MTISILPSENTAWGFYGTIHHHADPETAWPLAMQAVAIEAGCAAESVRNFLDSSHGRHFADDVAGSLFKGLPLQEAIDAAVERWMTWTIDRQTSRETGIPRGLPYLTGWVTHFEILADATV